MWMSTVENQVFWRWCHASAVSRCPRFRRGTHLGKLSLVCLVCLLREPVGKETPFQNIYLLAVEWILEIDPKTEHFGANWQGNSHLAIQTLQLSVWGFHKWHQYFLSMLLCYPLPHDIMLSIIILNRTDARGKAISPIIRGNISSFFWRPPL